MSDMSGPELQAQLVQWGCRVPTVLITAFPEDRVRPSAVKTGAVGILFKPFDDDELLACIQLALERKNGSKLD
jgi:FixJ family two-component response regulator